MLPFSSAHSPRQEVPMEQNLESRNESVTAAAAATTGGGMSLRQRLFAPNSSMLRSDVRAAASFSSSASSSSSTSMAAAAAAAAVSSCKSAVSISSRGSWFSLQGRSKRRISFGGPGELAGNEEGHGSASCAGSDDGEEDDDDEAKEGGEAEGDQGASEGGCATPRARESRIPQLFSCPGAPRKRKLLHHAHVPSSQHYHQLLHHAPHAADSSPYPHVPAFCRFASSPSRLIPQAQH